MDDFELDSMEAALSRAAERHAPPPLDPRRLRWRQWRLQAGPSAWLLGVVAAVGIAATSSWWLAAVLAVLLLPDALFGLRTRRHEVAALDSGEELASYEKRHFAALANSQRSAVILEAAVALLLAAIAWQTGEAWRWSTAAFFGAIAAGRLVAIVPWVERANRDAGGERPWSWTVLLLLLVVFALLPFVLVGKLFVTVWRALTRRRGGRS